MRVIRWSDALAYLWCLVLANACVSMGAVPSSSMARQSLQTEVEETDHERYQKLYNDLLATLERNLDAWKDQLEHQVVSEMKDILEKDVPDQLQKVKNDILPSLREETRSALQMTVQGQLDHQLKREIYPDLEEQLRMELEAFAHKELRRYGGIVGIVTIALVALFSFSCCFCCSGAGYMYLATTQARDWLHFYQQVRAHPVVDESDVTDHLSLSRASAVLRPVVVHEEESNVPMTHAVVYNGDGTCEGITVELPDLS